MGAEVIEDKPAKQQILQRYAERWNQYIQHFPALTRA